LTAKIPPERIVNFMPLTKLRAWVEKCGMRKLAAGMEVESGGCDNQSNGASSSAGPQSHTESERLGSERKELRHILPSRAARSFMGDAFFCAPLCRE
jgi:hypothetical protein